MSQSQVTDSQSLSTIAMAEQARHNVYDHSLMGCGLLLYQGYVSLCMGAGDVSNLCLTVSNTSNNYLVRHQVIFVCTHAENGL